MQIHSSSELDRLGDEIAELSAHLDAATARLLSVIREFDARGGWNTGFRSCAAWLSWRVGLDLGAARERVRVARALETLPLLADALACGQVSYTKVRALTRVATPETEARLLAAGALWTGGPKPGRPRNGMRAGPSTCTRTRTAWWSSGGGSSLKWGCCSSRRPRPRARPCTSGPGCRPGPSGTEAFPRNPACGVRHSPSH